MKKVEQARTVQEQIALLEERNLRIENKAYAEKKLLDIGFFRIGLYGIPFERAYPSKKDRSHIMRDGTRFEDIVQLYEFDGQLRAIYLKYLSFIETNFRTKVTYLASTAFVEEPVWFISTKYMTEAYVKGFDTRVYNEAFKNISAIADYHKRFIHERYAPAWKTLEFMSFGAVIHLFSSIKSEEVRRRIIACYGMRSEMVFVEYMRALLNVRNLCAHAKELYDYRLPKGIPKGPATPYSASVRHGLPTIQGIVYYLLREMSPDYAARFDTELYRLYDKYASRRIRPIVEKSFLLDD